jgi:hypothetical protein
VIRRPDTNDEDRKARTMHCPAERQYQASLGVARVRTAVPGAMPTAGSWSNARIAGIFDPKTTRPRRHPVTSP